MTETQAEQPGDDYFQDPLSYFARKRAEGPVVRVTMPDGRRAWLITGYDALMSSAISLDEVLSAGLAIREYLTNLVAAKRQEPGDDLLSALIAARDEGDCLDERELIGMLVLLLVACTRPRRT